MFRTGPYFTAAPTDPLIQLSIGDQAPGTHPGEPTHGEPRPSYLARQDAVQCGQGYAAETLRVWAREFELDETAASDDELGFYLLSNRHLDEAEVQRTVRSLLNSPHSEAWCEQLLAIQDWFLHHCTLRVYDFELHFFESPPSIKWTSRGWCFERGSLPQSDDPVVRGLDNLVLLFFNLARNTHGK